MSSSFSLFRLGSRRHRQNSSSFDQDNKSLSISNPTPPKTVTARPSSRKSQHKAAKLGQISGPLQLLSSTSAIADKAIDLKTMGSCANLPMIEEAFPPATDQGLLTPGFHTHEKERTCMKSQSTTSLAYIPKNQQRRPKLSIDTHAPKVEMHKNQNQSRNPIYPPPLRVRTYGSSGSASSNSPSLSPGSGCDTWPGSPVSSVASPTMQDKNSHGSISKSKSTTSLRSPLSSNHRRLDEQGAQDIYREHPSMKKCTKDDEVAQYSGLGIGPETPHEEQSRRHGKDIRMQQTHVTPRRSTSDGDDDDGQILHDLVLCNNMADDYIAEISDLCQNRFFEHTLQKGL